MSQTDRAANTMWAVSFMFINIVLAISVGIIFMAQSTPGKSLLPLFRYDFLATTPPYNKFVFGILVFTVICTIISFIGMSKVDPGGKVSESFQIDLKSLVRFLRQNLSKLLT